MVEAHEMVKDTGERRTYPNIMTREAVRGIEWEAWSEGNPPEHLVNIPFTRMLSGPVSYTPGIFDTTWDPGGPGRPPWRTLETTRVHSTRAAQMAIYPVYLSGLQMMADVPEHYEGEPELEFLEQVPTTWDDTKAINGRIGDHVTVARRSGQDWFVGSLTDEQDRTLSIPLRFLDSRTYLRGQHLRRRADHGPRDQPGRGPDQPGHRQQPRPADRPDDRRERPGRAPRAGDRQRAEDAPALRLAALRVALGGTAAAGRPFPPLAASEAADYPGVRTLLIAVFALLVTAAPAAAHGIEGAITHRDTRDELALVRRRHGRRRRRGRRAAVRLVR